MTSVEPRFKHAETAVCGGVLGWLDPQLRSQPDQGLVEALVRPLIDHLLIPLSFNLQDPK